MAESGSKKDHVSVGFRLDPAVYRRLRIHAAREGTTMAQVIRDLVGAMVERMGTDDA
jgi:predicted DNA-binding protein